jgi:hypothetical protein
MSVAPLTRFSAFRSAQRAALLDMPGILRPAALFAGARLAQLWKTLTSVMWSISGLLWAKNGAPLPCTIEKSDLNTGLTFGSPTARPEMSPSSSCSTARTEAPPPFDTLEAITIVLRLLIFIPRLANFSFSRSKANSIERRTFLPQSFSGLSWECACLKAKRFGVASLKAARWLAETSATKFASSPAVTTSARSPRSRLTVLVWRLCAPVPVPLSV